MVHSLKTYWFFLLSLHPQKEGKNFQVAEWTHKLVVNLVSDQNPQSQWKIFKQPLTKLFSISLGAHWSITAVSVIMNKQEKMGKCVIGHCSPTGSNRSFTFGFIAKPQNVTLLLCSFSGSWLNDTGWAMVPVGIFPRGIHTSRTQKSLVISHSSALSMWELHADPISLGGLK